MSNKIPNALTFLVDIQYLMIYPSTYMYKIRIKSDSESKNCVTIASETEIWADISAAIYTEEPLATTFKTKASATQQKYAWETVVKMRSPIRRC